MEIHQKSLELFFTVSRLSRNIPIYRLSRLTFDLPKGSSGLLTSRYKRHIYIWALTFKRLCIMYTFLMHNLWEMQVNYYSQYRRNWQWERFRLRNAFKWNERVKHDFIYTFAEILTQLSDILKLINDEYLRQINW